MRTKRIKSPMSDQDLVLDVLIAVRDAGLVTDRDQLNRAWSELTGRTVPAPISPPDPDLRHRGPCALCHQPTIRYGPLGSPLCPACTEGLS